MGDICLTYDDPREIGAVFFNNEEGGCYRVGVMGVTAIKVYRERGQGDFVPYFAIYKGDALTTRIPGHMVEVLYAEVA